MNTSAAAVLGLARWAVFGAGLLSFGTAAQAQQAPPRSAPTFGTTASAVVVDVVVRDRRGRPITDLTLKDFEVLEDGVRQQVGAMSMVAPAEPDDTDVPRRVYYTGFGKADAVAPDRTVSEGDDAVPGQAVMAIVFERLTPESREAARKAALSYLDTPERPGDFVGVFLLDLRLETIQTFTSDREKLKLALQAVAERATSFQNASRAGTGTGLQPATIGAEYRGGPTSVDNQGVVFQGIEEQIEESNRGLDNLQHGHASITGLQAVVKALGVLPGRKTVVYFSDCLPLASRSPAGGDGLRARFDQLIRAANRVNVAMYPIDAAGLRVHSQDVAHGQRLRQAFASDLNNPDGGSMAMAESIEILGGGSTSHVFGRLAKETGGFVIESTNDLAGGFRRIDADRRFHYLLTYTPRNTEFNGEYRRIEVKVARRGARVRARSGYVADNSQSR